MNKINKDQDATFFSLLSRIALIICFIYLFGSLLLTNFGIDGVCYALISRNMAEGLGSYWAPIYSLTQHNPFYEHPSLGLIIESWFFLVFGDKPYTEHIFATLLAAFTIVLLMLFWRKLYFKKEQRMPTFDDSWIVIFAWLTVPYLVYYYLNAGLEMLANIFALPSVYFLLSSCDLHDKKIKQHFLIFLSAISLFISIMINGPLTLFPLSFYFLYWYTYQEKSFLHYLKLTVFLCVYLCLVAIPTFYFMPDAFNNFHQFWDQQVLSSLLAKRYDATNTGFKHFSVAIDFIPQFKYLIITPIFMVLFLFKKNEIVASKALEKHFVFNKEALLTFMIGMSATLPILLSSKQSIHYTLQGGFFVLLSAILIILPLIKSVLIEYKLSFNIKRTHLNVMTFALIILISSQPLKLSTFANRTYDDLMFNLSKASLRAYAHDAYKIAHVVPTHSKIYYSLINANSNPDPLGNHLMRSYKIMLDYKFGAPYALELKSLYSKNVQYNEELAKIYQKYGYRKVNINLNFFNLYAHYGATISQNKKTLTNILPLKQKKETLH